MLRNSIITSLILAGAAAFACSAGSPSSGSNVSTGSGPQLAGGNGQGASAGGPGTGGNLAIGGSFGVGGGSGGTGNSSASCDGKFIGQLLDFTVAPGSSGASAGYQIAPDFEPANQTYHPTTTKIASAAYKQGTNIGGGAMPLSPTMYEPGIVAAVLGADGTPTYAKNPDGSNSDSTTGAANFQTWYHPTANVNLGENLPLQFVHDPAFPNDPDAYVYDSTSSGTDPATCPVPFQYMRCPGFFPADGKLLGNESQPHNYHMTFQMHLKFIYHAGQKFTFSGDDDVWVFVNNQLAVDLGGIHQELTQDANLSGLVDGMQYNLDFFWAERHVTAANFRIATSLHVTDCGTIK